LEVFLLGERPFQVDLLQFQMEIDRPHLGLGLLPMEWDHFQMETGLRLVENLHFLMAAALCLQVILYHLPAKT
jgi:hypothetical protein